MAEEEKEKLYLGQPMVTHVPPRGWQPGQSGNPGGKPRDKAFMRTVRAILDEDDGPGKRTKLEQVCRKMVELAINGEQWATQLICDRLDGKAPLTINVTREAREMSLDDIIAELAEARAAAGIAGAQEGPAESEQFH